MLLTLLLLLINPPDKLLCCGADPFTAASLVTYLLSREHDDVKGHLGFATSRGAPEGITRISLLPMMPALDICDALPVPIPIPHLPSNLCVLCVLCVRPIPPYTETYPPTHPISQKLRSSETPKLRNF